MKKILIIHTGGTIAMHEDENKGAILSNETNPLFPTIESLSSIATILVDDFLNVPSPHITPKLMLSLANRIKEKISKEKLDGIVITHGTDTLEETAYLLDLIIHTSIPIVVTGAMRSSNELGSDGPHNLISAVRVAASSEAISKGILVVFNDEIHTAKNVTKTHTSNIATFQSPQYGPIGIITKRNITFHHFPIQSERYEVKQLTKNVVLLKVYAGMDATVIEAIAQKTKLDGLIIEAFGQGNVPPLVAVAIKELLKNNIPVVLVSRSYSGIVQDIYGYEGGGKHLKEMGVIFTNGLAGQKARLKLMVALEHTNNHSVLQEMFLR